MSAGLLAALALSSAFGASAMIDSRKPAIVSEAPRPEKRKKRSRKRKAKAQAIITAMPRRSHDARAYALAKDFNPARSSTLRKTQKLLRIQSRTA